MVEDKHLHLGFLGVGFSEGGSATDTRKGRRGCAGGTFLCCFGTELFH